MSIVSLINFRSFLDFHEMQFGFTAGGGCDNAVFIMKSVIQFFTQYKSNFFVATLDLTKVYDRVSHCGLLIKLYIQVKYSG